MADDDKMARHTFTRVTKKGTLELVDEDTGEIVMRQQTRFDWHGATVDLILFNAKQKKGAIWTDAKEITGLVEDSPTKAHSKLVGVPDKDSSVDYHVLGLRIARNPQMMEELRRLFSIRKRKVFTNRVDYQDQLKEVKIEADAEDRN